MSSGSEDGTAPKASPLIKDDAYSAVDTVLLALLHQLEEMALSQQSVFAGRSLADVSPVDSAPEREDQALLIRWAHDHGRHAEATLWLMSIRVLQRQVIENSLNVRAMLNDRDEFPPLHDSAP